MTLDEAIISRLDGDSGVAAQANGRTYSGERPQGGDLPAVTFAMVSQERPQHLDGADDMITSRIQFDCWAKRPDVALRLANAVRVALTPPADIGGLLFWQGNQEALRNLREDDGTHRAVLEMALRHTDDVNE